jgi:tetratricopeptide (TPR) repeat protein
MEHKNQGNNFFMVRNFAQAKVCYEKAIKEDPNNIVFYSNLAAVNLEEHAYLKCIVTCKKAVEVGNANNADVKQIAKVLARMGRAYMKEQNFKEATNSFENALSQHKLDETASLLLEAKGFLRLENNPLVEVRLSNIHGKGVFAVQDIKKDEAVCLYDGKLMDEVHLLKLVKAEAPMDREYWMNHPRDPRLTLCGYKAPKTVLGIGQIINDYRKPEIVELNFKHGITACEEYVIASRKHQNVTFKADGMDFCLYAAKDINKDEELFLHYGYKIWLETFTKDLTKESTNGHLWRLLYWALDGEVHGMVGNGQAKVFRIGDAYDFDEKEYQSIVEVLLAVPQEALEKTKRIPNFSYRSCFISMMEMIDVDHVESFLD